MSTTDRPQRLNLRFVALVAGVAVVAGLSGTLATAALAGDRVFSDVRPDHPFADDIDFVADTGIAQGFADGTFRPNEPVTRQAMAAFLQRSQSYVVVAQQVSGSNISALAGNVRCTRSRHVAVSGGAVYQGSGRAFLSSSGPGTGGGWAVTMVSDDGVVRSMTMTAFAICVPGSRQQPEAAP